MTQTRIQRGRATLERRETRAERLQERQARKAYVDARVPSFLSAVHVSSASGPLESIWLRTEDPEGRAMLFDEATHQHVPIAARLTPSQARQLARVLVAYADTHAETPE